jgi:hypothetical protein
MLLKMHTLTHHTYIVSGITLLSQTFKKGQITHLLVTTREIMKMGNKKNSAAS